MRNSPILKTIRLGEYGAALSGRSRPKEILSAFQLSLSESLLLDFEGVEAVNQSFINELLNSLLDAPVGGIEFTNASDKIKILVHAELDRLNKIRATPLLTSTF